MDDKEREEIEKKIGKSLAYIWSECALEVITAKQYIEIKKIFEKKIKLIMDGKYEYEK